MPLSSEADSRLPSHSAGGERDNEGADSPRKEGRGEKKTSHKRGERNQREAPAQPPLREKLFLLSASPFLLRLFSQTDPQMLVQTCSNSPTDHVVCTSVTQANEGPPSPPFEPEVSECGTQTRRRRADLKARRVALAGRMRNRT